MNESRILLAYEPLIRKCVNLFMARAGTGRTSRKDDLLQEARISFLNHIRTHTPEEYGKCRLTILHDLCESVRRDYPMGISRHAFLNKVQPLHIYSFDDITGLEDNQNAFTHSDLKCSLAAVLKNHSAEDVLLVRMKAKGYSNREAARRLGMSDTQVTRKLKRIRMELNAQ